MDTREKNLAAAIELATSASNTHWGNSALPRRRNLYGKGVTPPRVKVPSRETGEDRGAETGKDTTIDSSEGQTQQATGFQGRQKYVVQELGLGKEGNAESIAQVKLIPKINAAQKTVRRPRNEPPLDPSRHMYKLDCSGPDNSEDENETREESVYYEDLDCPQSYPDELSVHARRPSTCPPRSTHKISIEPFSTCSAESSTSAAGINDVRYNRHAGNPRGNFEKRPPKKATSTMHNVTPGVESRIRERTLSSIYNTVTRQRAVSKRQWSVNELLHEAEQSAAELMLREQEKRRELERSAVPMKKPAALYHRPGAASDLRGSAQPRPHSGPAAPPKDSLLTQSFSQAEPAVESYISFLQARRYH